MTNLFPGGNTTDPEVKLLMEKFSTKAPGSLLTHEELAEIIGASPKSRSLEERNRYRTVIHRFTKKLLDDADIVLQAERGKGYRVLSADERVDAGVGTVGRGLRFVRRGGKAVSSVVAKRHAELSDSKKRIADHANRLIGNLMQAGRSAMREIKAPSMQRLPTRIPPGE